MCRSQGALRDKAESALNAACSAGRAAAGNKSYLSLSTAMVDHNVCEDLQTSLLQVADTPAQQMCILSNRLQGFFKPRATLKNMCLQHGPRQDMKAASPEYPIWSLGSKAVQRRGGPGIWSVISIGQPALQPSFGGLFMILLSS